MICGADLIGPTHLAAISQPVFNFVNTTMIVNLNAGNAYKIRKLAGTKPISYKMRVDATQSIGDSWEG